MDEYFAALPVPLREVAYRARRAIDAGLPQARSAPRWAHPTWSLGKDPVCYLKAASAPRSPTRPAGWRRTVDDVDERVFADWLRQARELHR